MKITRVILLAVASAGVQVACAASGATHHTGWHRAASRTFTVKADRMAVDNVTKVAIATGHVDAVSEPLHLRGELAVRDTNGVMRLAEPTELTTCTNHPGICHWSLKGEVEYKDAKYIAGRNLWLEFYEIPIFYLPYFYYPLDSECSFRIMPGWTERWGAYVMTKYNYDILGDPTHDLETWWLYGNTRFDLRYKNGIALGETLNWNLGTFGRGHFKIYYAWDENADEYEGGFGHSHSSYSNWGSPVERDRYRIELEHSWDVTERDVFHLQGTLTSDSYFYEDFMRNDMWTLENAWRGFAGNEISWEHNEERVGAGVSVSGPLNKFYGGTSQLPDIYFDVVPTPVFALPFNYESENRLGYLRRSRAEYGSGGLANPYASNPGVWADYDAVRFDTYHRVTAPVKAADVVSIVPRLAYRGTFWSDSGDANTTGWGPASDAGGAVRTIGEAGATFAGRGKAWISDNWQHMMEPYFDVLAQKAWYDGMSKGNVPYVFDNLDASVNWEDQFAGRGRNLPYTYYGVTPGFRNAFEKLEESGRLRNVLDFDVYAAFQFNHAEWYGTENGDMHKLAQPGSPNYGKSDVYVTPGARVRYFPTKDISLRTQVEYDPDYNAIPLAQFEWSHRLSKDFNYFVNYTTRNYRMWDFSSTPYAPTMMTSDDLNMARYDYVHLGFTQQPLDWFAWSPFLRWDCKEGDLESVGSWFDYLTDCLGFRLILEYRNKYTYIDGSEYDADMHVGFFVYLRALGPGMGEAFNR